VYDRIRLQTALYDHIRQSYSSVYVAQMFPLYLLSIFIQSPYTVSVSHCITPCTRVVYGSRAQSLYISVFLRKRSFTIVHVRPGVFTSYSHCIPGLPTVFSGFQPYLHRITRIPIVFTLYYWDSHRIYVVFVGFPPYLHRITGIPIVFTLYYWDSHRIYVVFVGFPSYLH
jgi:hypothetical protein